VVVYASVNQNVFGMGELITRMTIPVQDLNGFTQNITPTTARISTREMWHVRCFYIYFL